MSSSSASDSEDEAAFGRLVNITAADLVALGSRIRELVSEAKTSNGCLVETFSGSFNLVHILQLDKAKMVIRNPISGQFGDLSGPSKEALESEVQTINYIQEHTSIPVPEVFHFDTTANNEIGAPCIAVSYISGRTVSRLWFDAARRETAKYLEAARASHVAAQQTALRQSRFVDRKLPRRRSRPRPLLLMELGGGWNAQCCSLGSVLNNNTFLKRFWAPTNDKSPYAVGATKLLEEMLPLLPHSSEYVLALPDFDPQNVMADGEGNITGLIDWNNVQTVPGFIGCLRYPGWITRDWDPLMYGWPESSENSPEELQKYRAYCLYEMKQALKPQDRDECRLTEKSHIFEAFWIAVSNVGNRTSICQKLVEEAKRRLDKKATPDGLDQYALNILYGISAGKLEDEDSKGLRKGLQALMTL
ncbi:hypothetical protein INS49_008529 [Diaporthe citri]|uniref:uncharacterized protein n=1 Tax=Diaporthe citri TaxID=83186 RepID=UPI001C7F08F4|nr:uncharacterized protein INS49_008529 [Diaporthe citri]KAG6363430.1 hypothetical protein INS49_008529 [Diaporthe citri]